MRFSFRRRSFLPVAPVLGLALCGVMGMALAASSAPDESPFGAQDAQRLGWMEEALLGSSQAASQTVPDRLTRLELLVFGQSRSNEPLAVRMQALHEALLARRAASQPLPQAAPAQAESSSPATSSGQTPAAEGGRTSPTPQRPADRASELPMVDLLERKALGRAYGGEALAVRLARLEARVFGQPRRGVDSDRVDALRSAIMGPDWPPGQPDVITENTPDPEPAAPGLDTPPHDPLPDTAAAFPPLSPHAGADDTGLAPDQQARLSAAEMQTYRQTFVHDPPSARVARLEMTLFKRLAPDDTPLADRLDRVAAVATADPEHPLTSGGTPVSRGSAIRSLWPLIPMILLMFL